jgi:hypothetical protein
MGIRAAGVQWRYTMTETVKRPFMRSAPCCIECRGDGNQVIACIDRTKWPHEGGVFGFGDTLADALRSLADEIEKEVELR